jgi:hypothetical protein
VIGLATAEKSGPTVTETVAVKAVDPLVPVTVTVYGPGAMFFFVETVSVAEAWLPAVRVTLVGLIEAVSPVGDMDVLRVTVPAKVPRLVTVIVDVAVEELVATFRCDGAPLIENPVIFMLAMKVDQQFPVGDPSEKKQFPMVLL